MKRTTVVNLRRDDFDVYIGRAGMGCDGYFGNPFRCREPCARCGHVHMTVGSTIPCFKAYFYERLASDPEFKERVEALRGKVLGCFCKPKPCHGDIIAKYLNEGSMKPLWGNLP